MTSILTLRHERIDDIPLILGLAQHLHVGEVLERHLGTHGLQQGWSNGQLTVGWVAYILSQADHRLSAVRDWANSLAHTLEHFGGLPVRAVEFSDDRLGGLLRRLSDDRTWEAIERELWEATVSVYEVELQGVRLDSTTSYGYHQPTEDGLMQRGHSKDHRPDLPQLKLMAAAVEPSGHLIACDVHAGQCADDPLDTPLIQRVRKLLGRQGLLYTGDCKMAALATRADLAAHQDYYLMPLPRTGDTAAQIDTWVEAMVTGSQEATLLWEAEGLLGSGYEFTRPLSACVAGQPVTWNERVQVVRSSALAQRQARSLEQRLAAGEAHLWALTPAVGRGKRQIRDEQALQAAIVQVLQHHDVTGLLDIQWERHEHTITRYVGRGRGGPERPKRTEGQTRYGITSVTRDHEAIAARRHRLGWRVQVTNAPTAVLSLSEAVCQYRGGWVVERDFHLVKDLPLGLSPLFVWRDDHIKGLTRLLTLALRLLTLLEMQVRQGLAQAQTSLAGLYEGAPTRTTARPSGPRILQAFARAQLTLTWVEHGGTRAWYLTPLTPLHEQLLRYLHLPTSLYTALADNTS
jgi:transposase